MPPSGDDRDSEEPASAEEDAGRSGSPEEPVGEFQFDRPDESGTTEDPSEETETTENESRRVRADEPGNPRVDATEDQGPIERFLGSDRASVAFVREFVGSVLVVVMVGLLLFAISGVWPPMVAVKSGSMEPHMHRGDLVFVMEEHRLAPKAAVEGTGVATYRSSLDTGYRRFGDYGDVIVYRKDGRSDATPIIHRSQFWVSDGENWYDRANRSYVNGDSCESVPNCPAPHAGFITKGDHNDQYDQISGISGPVKPGWIKGTAEVRVPWLGHVRLELSEIQMAPVMQVAPAGSFRAGT